VRKQNEPEFPVPAVFVVAAPVVKLIDPEDKDEGVRNVMLPDGPITEVPD
jgi:hypothetical protein